MRTINAILSILFLALFSFFALPVQWIVIKISPKYSYIMQFIYYRLLLILAGFRVKKIGKLSKKTPLLVVANHITWADITVLGATIPGSFAATNEIEKLPFLSLLAKMQRTIYYCSRSKKASGAADTKIAQRILNNEPVIIFPEGTTNDGNTVIPFRSGLFGSITKTLQMSNDGVYIQPVAISYTKRHGIPLGRQGRLEISWMGSVNLAKQMWNMLYNGNLDVTIAFGKPLYYNQKTSRRIIAHDCWESTRTMLSRLNAGQELRPGSTEK